MTQSSNNYPYVYEDECISYKSLFPSFSKKDFDKLDAIYNQLDIDGEIKKLFSEYKINTTEDQAALHHVYRSAYGHKISSVHENCYEVAKSSISECIKLKEKLIQKGIKNIVTIGIGGSFEGPKLLLETLTQKHDRSFNHIFLTGPDTQEFSDEIDPLNKKSMVEYGKILLFLNDKFKGYEYIKKGEGVIKFTPSYSKIIWPWKELT